MSSLLSELNVCINFKSTLSDHDLALKYSVEPYPILSKENLWLKTCFENLNKLLERFKQNV